MNDWWSIYWRYLAKAREERRRVRDEARRFALLLSVGGSVQGPRR